MQQREAWWELVPAEDWRVQGCAFHSNNGGHLQE